MLHAPGLTATSAASFSKTSPLVMNPEKSDWRGSRSNIASARNRDRPSTEVFRKRMRTSPTGLGRSTPLLTLLTINLRGPSNPLRSRVRVASSFTVKSASSFSRIGTRAIEITAFRAESDGLYSRDLMAIEDVPKNRGGFNRRIRIRDGSLRRMATKAAKAGFYPFMRLRCSESV